MEIKRVTMESDLELVKQYIALRHHSTYQVDENGKAKGFPNEPIDGDYKAVFILAVENGQLHAGLRTSVPDSNRAIIPGGDNGWTPADKVAGARLETMFPNNTDLTTKMRANKEPGYKVLYIDGIFADISGVKRKFTARGTLTSILADIRSYAEEQQCGIVYTFPMVRNAKMPIHEFSRQKVKIAELGPQAYISHEGEHRGEDRNLVVFFLNEGLEASLRKNKRYESPAPMNNGVPLNGNGAWADDIVASRQPQGPSERSA